MKSLGAAFVERKLLALIGVLSLAVMGAACGEPGQDPDPDPEIFSIAATADAAGDFTVLLAALTEAGLASTFADDDAGPFTVFAPTDDAFTALLGELGISAEDLLASEDLGAILQYHVVSGVLEAADVLAAIDAGGGSVEVETLGGENITVTLEDGKVIINGTAEVIVTDIMATNGVIHVIDAVLLPE